MGHVVWGRGLPQSPLKIIGHVFELDCCDKLLVEAFCVGLTEIVSYFYYCALYVINCVM